MRSLRLLFFLCTLYSCSNQQSASIFSTDALPLQTFRINTSKDTALKTAGGALLKIEKESFSSGGEVELQVKEAYSMEDIIKAGLTTTSNRQPLRSGGMIYLSATDKNVSVKKAIDVSLPTRRFDPSMKVFKGEDKDGTMNWVDPVALRDSIPASFLEGERIFASNCATCHALDKQLTGPALRDVDKRGPFRDRVNLHKFTHNPGGFIPLTPYTQCLVHAFNGQIMPGFPQLSDYDLDKLYDFIKFAKRPEATTLRTNPKPACKDSCRTYDSIRYALQDRIDNLQQSRQELIDSNEQRIHYDRWNETGSTRLPEASQERGSIPKDLVRPDDYEAVYYRFDITSFGWYNIDDLFKDKEADWTTLKLTVDDNFSSKVDVFLAVPRLKTFDRGGKLTDGVHYGFFTRDGKIPLRIGDKLVLFTVGEVEGKVLFDSKEIIALENNEVQLVPKLITKEEFAKAIKGLSLERIAVAANDSKNAAEIRKVDAEIKRQEGRAEAFRPKNCDCNCAQSFIDTVAFAR